VGDGQIDPEKQKCFSNNGKNATQFIPSFPASCPYVTAVGATQTTTVGSSKEIREVAVSRFYSGGGFSNYFARPSYQDSVVEDYLNRASEVGDYLDKGYFNRGGRAYPDVAAEGDRFRIWVSGSAASIGGSSAATPVFAAVVALLNDARLKAGKKPLGFLDPWLYSGGSAALNDITSGHNGGCGTPGFSASKGWDPVTGFGTPDFVKLKNLALAKP